jgi:hypothetical protein
MLISIPVLLYPVKKNAPLLCGGIRTSAQRFCHENTLSNRIFYCNGLLPKPAVCPSTIRQAHGSGQTVVGMRRFTVLSLEGSVVILKLKRGIFKNTLDILKSVSDRRPKVDCADGKGGVKNEQKP